MTRYTMVADLNRCIGCQTCVAACRHANATSPAVQWRSVLDIESGSYPNVSRTFVPVGCQHCDDPPCMHVCPTTATRKRSDGIVSVDYNICIGRAYCDVACPYQARFKVSEPGFAYGAAAMSNEALRDDPERIGVSQKCTFCSDRIDTGLLNGLVPGRDEEATPACVNACIADALSFGDIEDPESNVSRLLSSQKHFRMHEHLGTSPNFYYLYDGHTVQAEAPHDVEPAVNGAASSVRGTGGEPRHQKHWDWKAAGNFLCGGAGSALFVFAIFGGLVGTPFVALGLLALAMVTLGLFGLLFKIGRPARSLYVLRQPQRSWMSREAWIAVFFFPAAVISLWMGSAQMAVIPAVLGLLFLFSQAMILKEAKGIPAWRSPRTVPLIVSTGLVEGSSLFAITAAILPSFHSVEYTAAGTLATLIALRSIAWLAYFNALKSGGAPTRTLQVLGNFQPWIFAFGIAVPIGLIGTGFVAQIAAPTLFAVAGSSAFVMGWLMKFILVTRAGYNEGFAIRRLPMSGASVADRVVKSGWDVLMQPAVAGEQ